MADSSADAGSGANASGAAIVGSGAPDSDSAGEAIVSLAALESRLGALEGMVGAAQSQRSADRSGATAAPATSAEGAGAGAGAGTGGAGAGADGGSGGGAGSGGLPVDVRLRTAHKQLRQLEADHKALAQLRKKCECYVVCEWRRGMQHSRWGRPAGVDVTGVRVCVQTPL